MGEQDLGPVPWGGGRCPFEDPRTHSRASAHGIGEDRGVGQDLENPASDPATGIDYFSSWGLRSRPPPCRGNVWGPLSTPPHKSGGGKGHPPPHRHPYLWRSFHSTLHCPLLFASHLCPEILVVTQVCFHSLHSVIHVGQQYPWAVPHPL